MSLILEYPEGTPSTAEMSHVTWDRQHGRDCPPLHEPLHLKNLHERQGLFLLSWCQPEVTSTKEKCQGASSGWLRHPHCWGGAEPQQCRDGFLSLAGQEGSAVPAGLAPNQQPGGGDSLC